MFSSATARRLHDTLFSNIHNDNITSFLADLVSPWLTHLDRALFTNSIFYCNNGYIHIRFFFIYDKCIYEFLKYLIHINYINNRSKCGYVFFEPLKNGQIMQCKCCDDECSLYTV